MTIADLKSVSRRFETALKVLPSTVAEALTGEMRENVRTLSHRQDVAANLEMLANGTAMKALSFIEEGNSAAAITLVRDGLLALQATTPELFAPSIATRAEIMAVWSEWFGRPAVGDAELEAAADRLGPGENLRRELTTMRVRLRQRDGANP